MSSLIRGRLSSYICASLLQRVGLNNLADHQFPKTMTGLPVGPYPGSIPDHGKLPNEQELPLQKKDGERIDAHCSSWAMMDNCELILGWSTMDPFSDLLYAFMQDLAVLSSWRKLRRRLAALPWKKLSSSILLRHGGFGTAFTQGTTLKTVRCAVRYLLSMRYMTRCHCNT